MIIQYTGLFSFALLRKAITIAQNLGTRLEY